MARRDLARGAMLGGSGPSQMKVTIAACGACGSTTDGIAIGSCGCGGGSPTSMAYGGGSNIPLPGGNFTSNPGGPMPPGNDVWDCNPGCYPRGYTQTRYMDALRGNLMSRPGWNPYFDWLTMNSLYSAVVTALPGVPVDIDIAPANGTFAAFYWEIVAIDPATGVQSVDWQVQTPTVVGCPVDCETTEPILAPLVIKVPEACCGNPFAAWLDRASENVPLRVTFTNNQAAGNLSVQVRLRGICCSTRIC